ncbi:2-C-methyl-D-erythritol 2,4-cyclodiphosphate synthase [bacterium]|nr:2-C-methyl-D-erythritol 2,4-cyclodiphosphate synthase [candidate division CSSED10-310 bacterium]
MKQAVEGGSIVQQNRIRVGIGYDAHQLVRDRKLILGGVHIPFEKGLLGHSDADVLLHAIGDAILGAAGRGDIGKHFPDTNPEYKDISSLLILKQIKTIVGDASARIDWIDAVIIAQRPKMMPFIDQMKRNIAAALDISETLINLKATTTEGMGFAGREEGIAAEAVITMSF